MVSWALGVYLPTTSHYATLHTPPISSCLYFSTMCHNAEGGSHPKTPEVKSAPRRDRDVHLSLDSRWSRRLQRILQGWATFTIRGNVPDWISRHGSHCPPLKAGFSKHTWTGDRSQMGASRRRGRRRKVPCLASGGRGSVTPPPNQSGFPCAGLTRGSW